MTDKPAQYVINGKPLQCLICGADQFRQRPAQLQTAEATLLGVNWASPSARCVVCAPCGYIHWFLPPEA